MKISKTLYQIYKIVFILQFLKACNWKPIDNDAVRILEERNKNLEIKQFFDTYAEKIKKHNHCDNKIFDNNLVLKEFIMEIVDNKNKESIFYNDLAKPDQDTKNFIENFIQLKNRFNAEEIRNYLKKKDNFYNEIKNKLISLESYNGERDKLDDYKKNKVLYMIECIERNANTFLNEYWSILIKNKITTKNYREELLEIYLENSQVAGTGVVFLWLEYKLIGFLADKYISSSEEPVKVTTLNILIVACNGLRIPKDYIPENRKPYSDVCEKIVGVSYTFSEICRDSEQKCNKTIDDKNFKKIQNLKYVVDIIQLRNFESDIFKIEDFDIEKMKKEFQVCQHPIEVDSSFFKFHNCLVTNLYNVSEILKKIESNSVPFFEQNKSYIQSQVLYFTSSIIQTYRYYLHELFDYPSLLIENGLFKITEKSANSYCKFIVFMILFNILDSTLPKEIKNLCLDASSYTLEYFVVLNYDNNFRELIALPHEIKKELFNEKYEGIINTIYQKNNNIIKTLAYYSVIQLDDIKYKVPIVSFLSFLILLRFDMENICKFNILSFLEKFKTHSESTETQKNHTDKIYEKKRKLLKEYKPYFELYTHEKITRIMKEEVEFYDVLNSIMRCIRNPRFCKSIDLKAFIDLIIGFNSYDQFSFKILRSDFFSLQHIISKYEALFSNHFDLFLRQIFTKMDTYSNKQEKKDENLTDNDSENPIQGVQEPHQPIKEMHSFFECLLENPLFIYFYFIHILYDEIEVEFQTIVSEQISQAIETKKTPGSSIKRAKYTETKPVFGYFKIYKLLLDPEFKEVTNIISIYDTEITYIRENWFTNSEFNMIIVLKYYDKTYECKPNSKCEEPITEVFQVYQNIPFQNEIIKKIYVYQREDELFVKKLAVYLDEKFNLEKKKVDSPQNQNETDVKLPSK